METFESEPMSDRKLVKIQRRVATSLSEWKDPHGHGKFSENGSVNGVEVDAEGAVKIAITPLRAHCPCCLLDLGKLRTHLLGKKAITSVHIEIVNIPAAERWTKSINA